MPMTKFYFMFTDGEIETVEIDTEHLPSAKRKLLEGYDDLEILEDVSFIEYKTQQGYIFINNKTNKITINQTPTLARYEVLEEIEFENEIFDIDE